jgi:transposase InsO family protein
MSDQKFPRGSSRKPANSPGKRYTEAQKAKIVRLARRIGVARAAQESGASPWSIYRWRHEQERLRSSQRDAPTEGLVMKPARIQVPQRIQRQVLEVWKNNPGFGPSQVRGQLRRVGVRCDTKTIRKILRAYGYTPPAAKPPRPREPQRFEASRPLELVQMDVLQFHVHAQRLYLMLALDDHSRFITGWDLLQRESMLDAISVVEEAIRRYGKPEAILTDRGATFHTWQGLSRFDRFLEAYGIDHILASPGHPQTCGKIEAVNKAIQKELIDRVEFRNYLDAKEQIGRWIDEFNHQRTHQGLGGVLVPADRFYGRADRVLGRIERGARRPVPPELETSEDSRRISLFQLLVQGDIIEVWLFGRLVARLRSPRET